MEVCERVVVVVYGTTAIYCLFLFLVFYLFYVVYHFSYKVIVVSHLECPSGEKGRVQKTKQIIVIEELFILPTPSQFITLSPAHFLLLFF